MTPGKRLISFLVLLSTALGLVAAPAAHAAPPAPAAPVVCKEPFYLNDERFGPKDLPPPSHVVGKLLNGYERFGDAQNPVTFLNTYWGDKGWKYPANDGFAGTPTTVVLQPGQFLDRFGGQSGRFLSPTGTPFAQRSLPPQSLNTCEYEKGTWMPYGYYRYKILKEFPVLSGTAAKWFGQPGGGTQYKVVSPVDPPQRRNVAWLVANGYLGVVG
ncbi:TNT domain-containing protein [Saccharothrix sp. Mg75]|uniref:TNT domain-containing protein n=1 Tax=Saccharothrix sp. Mg75 TaxID=3445357 RepID=UPI003EEF66CC